MSSRPNGLDSALGMLADMQSTGMISEADRQKAAIAHLEKVYGISPVVLDLPCLTCHDASTRERAAIVAFLRRYKYPTDPEAWAKMIEDGEHLKDAADT